MELTALAYKSEGVVRQAGLGPDDTGEEFGDQAVQGPVNKSEGLGKLGISHRSEGSRAAPARSGTAQPLADMPSWSGTEYP